MKPFNIAAPGLALILLAPLSAQEGSVSPQATELMIEVVTVPLDHSSGYAVVGVRFGDGDPYRLIFDTGASVTVLNKDLADELGLEVTGTTRIGDPVNPMFPVDQVMIPELAIGDAYFIDMRAVAWERPVGLRRLTRGILGLPTFKDCLVTLDYDRNEMRIEGGALPPANGRDIIDIEVDHGVIRFPITVNGQTVIAYLDSGNPGGVILPDRMMESLGIVEESIRTSTAQLAGGPIEFKSAQLEGEIAIGPVTLKSPTVKFDSVLGFANVGNAFLVKAAVTIDLANARMRIRLNGQPVEPQAQVSLGETRIKNRVGRRPFGIQARPSGSTLIISKVTSGSLADRTGIRVGDRLIEVEGEPLSRDGAGDVLGQALSRPDAFSIVVERDGKKVELTVPAEKANDHG